MKSVAGNYINVEELTKATRSAIAGALRERVIGPNADEKAAAINDTAGDPMFAADRAIHIVHSDSSMFIGGMRALLLQSLHPLAMAGVAQHSDYRTDPWGRLQRTAEFLAATTFGSRTTALSSIERVKAVHRRVSGVASDGRPYSASDPHLLRWVHIAELDSFLAAHTAYGATRLTQDQRDEYITDMAIIARALGVPAPPTSEQMLKDQLRSYRGELRSTQESRDAAKYLLATPPLSLAARVPYTAIAASSIAILPVWSRSMLRLPWLPLTERLALQPLGSAISKTIRWAIAGEEQNAVQN